MGPLGKKRAPTIHDGRTAQDLASHSVEWAESRAELTPHMNGSLVEALKRSGSFRRTDVIWARLHEARDLAAARSQGSSQG